MSGFTLSPARVKKEMLKMFDVNVLIELVALLDVVVVVYVIGKLDSIEAMLNARRRA